jgi:hypothetical protein
MRLFASVANRNFARLGNELRKLTWPTTVAKG